MNLTRQAARRPSLLAGIALAAAIGLALPSSGAQLVNVRAGVHPGFTRVVFELDGPAGYRVEEVGTAAAPMLRVSLDAGSRFHRLRSTGDVRDVKVTAGTRSVATIALSRSGLRVQEMILSNPHRIVLDLYRPESALAKTSPARKPAAKPTPAPVAKPTPAPAVAPAPKPVAKPEPTREPTAGPATEPAETPPVPIARADAPEPAPTGKPAAGEPTPAETPTPPAKPEPVRKIAKPLVPKPAARPAPAITPVKPDTSPAPAITPVKPDASPAPTFSSSWMERWRERLTGDPVWQGGVAAVALALLAVVFVAMRRRRALPNDLDVTAIAEEVEASGRAPAGGVAMEAPSEEARASADPAEADSEASFAGLFDESDDTARPDEPREPAVRMPAEGPRSSAPAESGNASLFDDAGESAGDDASQGDAPMNQYMDLPADPSTSPPPTVTGGAAAPSAEVMQMLQDFERRMQTLEAKLDEANEAREKLERQVAAQSEELRVQRAAIARTQRALRTMSRADEDKATEPALRDGDAQAKTRVNV